MSENNDRRGRVGALRSPGWPRTARRAPNLLAQEGNRYPTDEPFYSCQVPRFPTAGETSAAALRFLAAGTPVVVSGYAQFLELPAEAALRMAPGRAGVAELARHVAGLAASARARDAARVAARRAWERGGHDPTRAAATLLAAVRDLGRALA